MGQVFAHEHYFHSTPFHCPLLALLQFSSGAFLLGGFKDRTRRAFRIAGTVFHCCIQYYLTLNLNQR
jgi:hypothetical protein